MRAVLLTIMLFTTAVRAAVHFEALADVGDSVWGIDFLPSGEMIFTQKSGKLSILNLTQGNIIEVSGLPAVRAHGQGGLLDVRVHPRFKENQLIYFSYTEPVGSNVTTAIMRARLVGHTLVDQQRLFSGHAPSNSGLHFGSRIEFDGEGHIFFTMGERGQRDFAQQLTHHQGKLMRLNEDGSVPMDNPFVQTSGARPEIWALGLRSPQGLARHPVTGQLWEAEMGPQGGDEVNLISRGINLGWPVITYGEEYGGGRIGTTAREGMAQPVTYWVPSISPSGITFYSGDKYPQWRNNLFIATLSGGHVRRLEISENRVTQQEELLGELGLRWRCPRTGPDGYLYLSTDDGRIGRLIVDE